MTGMELLDGYDLLKSDMGYTRGHGKELWIPVEEVSGNPAESGGYLEQCAETRVTCN